MGYKGNTYAIRFDKGGLNHNKNLDLVPPYAMIHPSRNLNLHRNGREKRGGTAHVYGAAISGTPQLLGAHDYTLVDGTQYIVVVGADGSIYRDNTNTIKTGWTTSEQYADFEVFANELYIVNGYNTPEKWTGTGNTTTLTAIPSDWTGSNQPQWIIKHGRGVSERLWAGGVASKPHTVYASVNNDGDDFSDANVVTIIIETGDGFGIVGAIEFGDRLLCFGKRRVYIIDDSSSTVADWGYSAAQWDGGAASFRLICRTPNDIVAMTEDGDVYSVAAAEAYGDYKAASIARPAFINEWIKEHLDLTRISQFHMLYDPALRAIKIFGVRKGQTTVDTALVYFVDRGAENGWMPHDNQSYVSGYSASCSALVRASAGDYKVYTGDYSGMLWKLEEANKNDNSNGFYGGFKTPYLPFDNVRRKKKYRRGWVVTEPKGDYDLVVDWWIDATQKTQRTVSLAGTGDVLGSFTLGTSLLGGTSFAEEAFDLGDIGKRIQFEIYNSAANYDFFLSQTLIDFKYIGGKPS